MKKNYLLWINITLLILLVLQKMFNIIEYFAMDFPFTMMLLLCFITLILGMLILSVVNLGKVWKLNKAKAVLPLVMLFVLITSIFLIKGVSSLNEIERFSLYESRMNKVVEKINEGSLQPGSDGYVKLPLYYKNLSVSSKVYVIRHDNVTNVWFFRRNDYIDPGEWKSCYVYTSDNDKPFDIKNDYSEIASVGDSVKSIKRNWFWVGASYAIN